MKKPKDISTKKTTVTLPEAVYWAFQGTKVDRKIGSDSEAATQAMELWTALAPEFVEELRRFAVERNVCLQEIRVGMLEKNNKNNVTNFPSGADRMSLPDQELLDEFMKVLQEGDAETKRDLRISLSVLRDQLRAHPPIKPKAEDDKDSSSQQGGGSR